MPRLTRRTLLQALLAQTLPPGTAGARAVAHRDPTPLAPGAVTHDWVSFLGPSHDAISTETPLRRALPPPLVWELPKGSGYTSPAIAGDRLLFIHRIGDEELVGVDLLVVEIGPTIVEMPVMPACLDALAHRLVVEDNFEPLG